MDKKLDTPSTLRYVTKITFAHVWDVTSRNYRLTLPFFKFTLTEADVKFGLVKFCYIFFILYAIYDILMKTVKNNIVACLCNVLYTNLSLWNTTRHHLTCVVLSILRVAIFTICFLFASSAWNKKWKIPMKT
jgi:ABC-type proline/glycine betaine transport system permease subunit